MDARGTSFKNLTDHPADDRVPSWSNDGQYIYFASKRSENYQIYKMPIAGVEPVQITKNGGFVGFESDDSRYLYFKKYDELYGPVYRINLITLEESVAITENVSVFQWSVEKNGIYYLFCDENDCLVLKLYRFDTEQCERLGTFESSVNFCDVSPNGTHLLGWRFESFFGEIYMVDNFH
jgi:dipeptidyl aminopeptidase/acylaminoacyl peptidase